MLLRLIDHGKRERKVIGKPRGKIEDDLAEQSIDELMGPGLGQVAACQVDVVDLELSPASPDEMPCWPGADQALKCLTPNGLGHTLLHFEQRQARVLDVGDDLPRVPVRPHLDRRVPTLTTTHVMLGAPSDGSCFQQAEVAVGVSRDVRRHVCPRPSGKKRGLSERGFGKAT